MKKNRLNHTSKKAEKSKSNPPVRLPFGKDGNLQRDKRESTTTTTRPWRGSIWKNRKNRYNKRFMRFSTMLGVNIENYHPHANAVFDTLIKSDTPVSKNKYLSHNNDYAYAYTPKQGRCFSQWTFWMKWQHGNIVVADDDIQYWWRIQVSLLGQ
jgi:hypothetical protein